MFRYLGFVEGTNYSKIKGIVQISRFVEGTNYSKIKGIVQISRFCGSGIKFNKED